MKLLRIFAGLLCITFLFKPSAAAAQQAKAFERVSYMAKDHGRLFVLGYADGYLAATTLTVSAPNKKKLSFFPESGTPDPKGDFVLRSKQDGSVKITLTGIPEDGEAPAEIRAAYETEHRRTALVFKRKAD